MREMIEIILASATTLGGIASIWYFWDKFNGVKKPAAELNNENDAFFCSVAGIPYAFVPAQIDDLRWIAEVDSMTFHGIDAMPFTVLEEWYLANKDAFVIVRGCEGKNYGYFIVLPLKSEALTNLCEGKITDITIKSKDVLKINDKSCEGIYISALVLLNYGKDGKIRFGNQLALKQLLESKALFDCIFPYDTKTRIYAVAGSLSGEQIIKHLGFNLAVSGSKRSDCHPMYYQNIKKLKENILKLGFKKMK